MRRWAFFVIFSLPFFLFVYCTKDLEEEKRVSDDKKIESYLKNLSFIKENGVYHAIVTPGYGYSIVDGDSVAFWFKGYTLDNKVFDTNILSEAIKAKLDTSTRNFDSIIYVVGSNSLIEGLNRGIPLCRGGETSKIAFSSIYGFGNENIGPITAWSPLGYDITIIYVYNSSIRKEEQTIDTWIQNSELSFAQHSTGFWYNINVQGTLDINPQMGDTIYGWYREMTPDGEIIFEVQELNKILILGDESLTFGLSTGFTLLEPGEEASLVVPSPIAYGINGTEIVQPYTPVIYQIRLDSIK